MDNYNENKIKTYVRIWTIVGISVTVLIAAVVITFVAISNSLTRGDPVRNIYNITYDGDSEDAGGVWVADMMGANVIEVHTNNSAGSGFIITMDGDNPIALTNYHVVESAGAGGIGSRTVYETGAYALGCTLLGYDAYHDVAVLKLPATYKDYTFLDLLNEDPPKDDWFADPVLGEKLYAIGNALGEGLGMVDGICSKQSTVLTITKSNKTVEKIVPVFQTTAAINSGMSGSPVFNKYGQIVGIGTYKTAGVVNTDGTVDDPDDMNYAVPINIALEIYKSVKANSNSNGRQVSLISATETSGRSYTVGFSTTTSGYQFNAFGLSSTSGVSLHGALGFSGVMRMGVGVNNKGLKVSSSRVSGLSTGDVITEINGVTVDDYGKLCAAIYKNTVIGTNVSEPVELTLDSGSTISWQGSSGGTHYRVVSK